jgi:hypothetical protein
VTNVQYLPNVLIGDNPTEASRWTEHTGQVFDILGKEYGISDWSIRVRNRNIGPGTVGWMYRADGDWGHLAAIMVFGLTPEEDTYVEPSNRKLRYRQGVLFPLPREWWVDGARIHQHGWSSRAPWGGKIRRFQNGEQLSAGDVQVLRGLLHPVASEWLDATVRRFKDAMED